MNFNVKCGFTVPLLFGLLVFVNFLFSSLMFGLLVGNFLFSSLKFGLLVSRNFLFSSLVFGNFLYSSLMFGLPCSVFFSTALMFLLLAGLRIRMVPHYFWKLDPDLSEKLDPDPH